MSTPLILKQFIKGQIIHYFTKNNEKFLFSLSKVQKHLTTDVSNITRSFLSVSVIKVHWIFKNLY